MRRCTFGSQKPDQRVETKVITTIIIMAMTDNDNDNDTLYMASCNQCFHFVKTKGLFRHLSLKVGKLLGHCTQSPLH